MLLVLWSTIVLNITYIEKDIEYLFEKFIYCSTRIL